MSIIILDPKELANRLGYEHKIIKKAIAIGQLQPGVHFFECADGGPRFEWNSELIKKLHESCRKQSEARTAKVRTTTTQSKINFGSLGLADLDSNFRPRPSKPPGLQ